MAQIRSAPFGDGGLHAACQLHPTCSRSLHWHIYQTTHPSPVLPTLPPHAQSCSCAKPSLARTGVALSHLCPVLSD